MKELRLLVWLTQLGLSAALPLAGFVLLGIWLHRCCGWGRWSIWTGLLLGFYFAVKSFRESLKAMERMEKQLTPPGGVSHDQTNTSEEQYGQ